MPDEATSYLDTSTALYVYGLFILTSIIMTTSRNILFYKICMTASKNLHNSMFSSLLKAPMRFFDLHSSGNLCSEKKEKLNQANKLTYSRQNTQSLLERHWCGGRNIAKDNAGRNTDICRYGWNFSPSSYNKLVVHLSNNRHGLLLS